MAKDLENLVFTINIEGGQQARAMLEKIADSFDKVGDKAEKADKQTGQVSAALLSFASFAGTLAANAVSFLTRELTQLGIAFARDVVAEAAEGEQSIIALEAAIRNAGLEVTTTKEALDGLTDSLVRTTTFTDDEIMAAETLAIRLGWTTDEIEKYFQTAADLATSKGATLSDSVLALNKSLSGNAGALQRILPDLKNFSEAELKAGAAIEYVNKTFGGASAAALNTYSGQVTQLSKAWDDLKEALGAPIIRELRPFIESITASMRQFVATDEFKKFADDIGYNIGVAAAWIEEFILFMQGKPNALTGLFGLERGGTLFDRFAEMIRFSLNQITEIVLSWVSDPKTSTLFGELGLKLGYAVGAGIIEGTYNAVLGNKLKTIGASAEYVYSSLSGGPMSMSWPEYAKARGVPDYQNYVSPVSGASTTINQNIQVHSVTNGDDLVRQLNTAASAMKPLE